MTTEETIITLLQGAGIQVYPGSVPEDGTYPNVVFQVISEPLLARTHDGTEVYTPRVQFSVWAETYEEVVLTTQTVKDIFTLNRTDFKLATKENEIDFPEEVEAGYYRRIIEFLVWPKE